MGDERPGREPPADGAEEPKSRRKPFISDQNRLTAALTRCDAGCRDTLQASFAARGSGPFTAHDRALAEIDPAAAAAGFLERRRGGSCDIVTCRPYRPL